MKDRAAVHPTSLRRSLPVLVDSLPNSPRFSPLTSRPHSPAAGRHISRQRVHRRSPRCSRRASRVGGPRCNRRSSPAKDRAAGRPTSLRRSLPVLVDSLPNSLLFSHQLSHRCSPASSPRNNQQRSLLFSPAIDQRSSRVGNLQTSRRYSPAQHPPTPQASPQNSPRNSQHVNPADSLPTTRQVRSFVDSLSFGFSPSAPLDPFHPLPPLSPPLHSIHYNHTIHKPTVK